MTDGFNPFGDDISRFMVETCDKGEHILQVRGPELYYSLQDFDNYLRNMIKHAELSEAAINAYEDAREKLRTLVCDPWEEF